MLKVYSNLAQEPEIVYGKSIEEKRDLNVGIDYYRIRPSERSAG
jgi:hypothetical protein